MRFVLEVYRPMYRKLFAVHRSRTGRNQRLVIQLLGVAFWMEVGKR